LFDALRLIGEGDLAASEGRLRAAASYFEVESPYVNQIVAAYQGYNDYFAGHFARGVDRYRALHISGVQRGDPGMAGWGLNGVAMCRVPLGDDTGALEALAGADGLVNDALADLLRLAVSALAEARSGSPERAVSSFDAALSRLGGRPGTLAVMLPSIADLAEAAVVLRYRGRPEQRRRLAGQHHTVVACLGHYQRRFPLGRAMYLLRRAELDLFEGDRNRAESGFARAADQADLLGLPYEAALARAGLAAATGDDPARRRALESLARIGIRRAVVIRGPGSLERIELEVA
jgi:hypothetical protein